MSGAGPVAGGKNAPLEGLRAVAIFLVLFYHAGAPGVSVGWLGVDLFFVLSGFLITTILLREYARTDRVALGNFWHRRILRLVPAYAVYAILMTTLLLMAAPTPEGSYAPADLVTAIWTYTVNYLPLGGITERQYLTRHLWSLSLEWQYYLVFPLLLVGMLRAGRWWIPFAFILGVIVLDAAVDLPGHPRLTMNGRGVSLLIGSATAYYLFNFQDALQPWFARLHVPAIVIAIACFARLEAAHTGEIAGSVTILLLFWTACAIVIGSYWYGASSFGAALLSIPAIVFIGQISYGMYLWHMIGWEIVWVHLDPAWFDGWNRFVAYGTKLTLYVSFAVIAATASFYMVERPFLALKRRPVAAARPAEEGPQ